MRIKFIIISALFSALLLACFGVPIAMAQEQPKLHKTYKDWAVFTVPSDGDTICYVRSFAQDKAPKNVDHGDVVFFVTIWKSNAAVKQSSLMTGYTIKAAPPPTARVGNTRIAMYPADNEAFVEEDVDERKLVAVMRKGSRLRVDARSARGTATTYEFSLSGITAALQKAESLCK